MLFLSYDGREGRIEKAWAPLSETDSRLGTDETESNNEDCSTFCSAKNGKNKFHN